MIDMPPVLPDDYPPSAALVEKCTAQAAAHYNLPPLVIMAIAQVEGGKVGTVSPNSDGSFDFGLMQINSIHLPLIKERFNLGWRDLTYKPCINIAIGSWILATRVRESDDIWTGVGNYHSRTPKFHKGYKERVLRAYQALLSKSLGLAQR